MSAAIAAAVVVGGATVYAAGQAADSADAALQSADANAALQYEISKEQIDLAKEQWSTYKTKVFPLELEAQQLGLDAQQLAYQRGETDLAIYQDYYAPMQREFATQAMEGIDAQPERAARDARFQTDRAFDGVQEQTQRSLQRRGVRPGSGAGIGAEQDIGLNRAAAQSFNVNRAIEGEYDRVEDVNFNRMASALGRQPLAQMPIQGAGSAGASPATAAGLMSGAANSAYGAGSAYTNMAQMQGDAASGIANAGIQLGTAAYDIYNKYRTPQTTYTPYSGSTAQGMDNFSTMNFDDISASSTAFKDGGLVEEPPRLQRGEYRGGMVNGPPGVDQVPAYIEGQDGQRHPARLTDQEYVIPADVVRRIGTDTLDEIIGKNEEKKNSSRNKMALNRTSRGRS